MNINFRVDTLPVAQPRQRVAVRGEHAVQYTPTRHPVNGFKAAIQTAFAGTYDGPPCDGPVSIGMQFILPRPQSQIRKTKPNPRLWAAKKPDWDNLAKAVCDALNQIAYRDDKQIVEAVVRKQVAAGEERPHVLISIREIRTGVIDERDEVSQAALHTGATDEPQ